MTTTLWMVTPRKKKPEPSAEAAAAAKLVRPANEQGLSLTGPGGLLKQLTKAVLETALNEEMTEHLGYGKHDPAGAGSDNIRNGSNRRAGGPGRHGRAADRPEASTAADRRAAFEHLAETWGRPLRRGRPASLVKSA
jgi:Transposase, Mutator family